MCSNNLTVSDIYKMREWFLKKSREVQGQFLLNFFQVSHSRSKGQRTVYDHNVEKKTVCQKAWIFSHGMAYGRYVTLVTTDIALYIWKLHFLKKTNCTAKVGSFLYIIKLYYNFARQLPACEERRNGSYSGDLPRYKRYVQ